MNRTLLLILCDFLLMNLLALTSWEKATPAPPSTMKPSAAAKTAPAKSPDQDMVDMMKLSLEDERARREELAKQLQDTSSTLEEREKKLSDVSNSLQETKQSAQQLSDQLKAASQDASMSKERLAQLQRDLERREDEAKRREEELNKLQTEQKQSQEKIESLNVAVKVAEQEKQMLRANAETLKQQVVAEREERLKVQETTTQLAQGVGTLAEKSGELTKEIRDNRPINANILFNEFLANRVQAHFELSRKGFLGNISKNEDARTVFVTDGQDIFAILHIDDTPFAAPETVADWASCKVTLSKNGEKVEAPGVRFLAVDPRVVAIPVTQAEVDRLQGKVYKMALDPFKFPEAVLISNGGAGYGEVPFKLDPNNRWIVQMDNRLVRRLFGTFSPSKGDLVLSKSGELLGLMVNSDYCAIVNNFLPLASIPTGDDIAAQETSNELGKVAARRSRLPLKMQ